MIRIFQHGVGEPPGRILDILREKELEYEIIRLYAGDLIPDRPAGSGYIFLGGLMSVNDETIYPWLPEEKNLIREAIRTGLPVLGICLGAQLIASSLSCKVTRCTEEKGWTVIRKPGRPSSARDENEITVFEWHGECFDLPPGASLVYRGDLVPNQMFTIGSATGVQFHPEVNESIIRQWIAEEPRSLQEKILLNLPACLDRSMRLCDEIMDRFIQRGD